MARTSRRSKAVGVGSVGSKGFRVLSVRSAEAKEESISSGRRGLGPPRKPMAFCACSGLLFVACEELKAGAWEIGSKGSEASLPPC